MFSTGLAGLGTVVLVIMIWLWRRGEVCSGNTAVWTIPFSGCVWRFVMKRWWGHIRAEINTSIRSPVITGWGQAARNKYREQTLCDDVMWCDIWPTVAQALNVGRAMLWLCPGPTKKVYSYWPPTIGLETIPALNANINKNLKLIFLVRQRDRGLCCLQHTWDI